MAEPYQIMQWWKKVVEVRTMTEEGGFIKDNLPESYGGPELDVEIVQRVIFTDSSGVLLELRMDDLAEVQDKDLKKGPEATFEFTEGEPITIAAVGDSTEKVTLEVRVNTGLSQSVLDKAETMYALMIENEGGV